MQAGRILKEGEDLLDILRKLEDIDWRKRATYLYTKTYMDIWRTGWNSSSPLIFYLCTLSS
jgi:hypothetical protein